MQVDFAPPVGYTEPERPKKSKTEETEPEPSLEGIPEEYINRGSQQNFPGKGARLDGKKKKTKESANVSSPIKASIIKKGIPDLNYKIGCIEFKRKILKPLDTSEPEAQKFEAFSCDGNSLRKKK